MKTITTIIFLPMSNTSFPAPMQMPKEFQGDIFLEKIKRGKEWMVDNLPGEIIQPLENLLRMDLAQWNRRWILTGYRNCYPPAEIGN